MDPKYQKYNYDGAPLSVLKRRYKMDQEWYSLRSILGHDAIFYFLLGGREAGKSYAVTDFFCRQFKKYGRPFYWLRLSDTSQKKLLQNNAEKLVDPDLRRKYDLDLFTKGDKVYAVLERDKKTKKVTKYKHMASVLSLATFYNDKGSGWFDKDFLNDPNMFYNICLDEMNRELNEKKTFDILYAFTNQLENLVRSTKQKLRVICIGNTLEEASDILTAFNYLPEEFGRFAIKKKKAVIEYIEPSEKYKQRRKGTVADILMPTASTFTNVIEVDRTLITKRRLMRPEYVIKFNRENMFTVWDGNVVTKWNGERVQIIPMRPYQDELFNVERRNAIIDMFDTRSYMFRNLITQKLFKKQLELLRPKK